MDPNDPDPQHFNKYSFFQHVYCLDLNLTEHTQNVFSHQRSILEIQEPPEVPIRPRTIHDS
jgi:hypothetical protein